MKDSKNIVDRVPPCNIDAERAVLGSMLQLAGGAQAIQEALSLRLLAKHFYNTSHQKIYTAILALNERNEPADFLTVSGQLEQSGDLQQVGGLDYLNEMTDATPTAENVEYYIGMVLEAAMRRGFIDLGRKADDDTVTIEELISDYERVVTSLQRKATDLQGEPESANDLMESEQDDPAMIIGRGLLPAAGYSMLASFTKIGKTTLGIQMCLSIAAGVDFLGFPIEKQANVLYCYLENTRQSMAKMIRQQLAGWGQPAPNIEKNLHLLESRGMCLQERSGVDFLKKKIEAVQADLVVIDPVSLCMLRDMNDIAVIRSFVRLLQGISADTQVSWLLIHHYGKPTVQKRQAIQAMLGSSGWGNFCESFIGMERFSDKRPPDYKRLTFNLRQDRTPEDLCIYLNPLTRLFEIVENPEEIPAMSSERVRDILQKHDQPASFTFLRTLVEMQLGISESHATRLIQDAKEKGIIIKGPGKFGKYTHGNIGYGNNNDSNPL